MPVNSSSDAPVTLETTRWPAYATKAALLSDLESAIGGGAQQIMDIMRRLSNTDTSAWADKGSNIA